MEDWAKQLRQLIANFEMKHHVTAPTHKHDGCLGLVIRRYDSCSINYNTLGASINFSHGLLSIPILNACHIFKRSQSLVGSHWMGNLSFLALDSRLCQLSAEAELSRAEL